MLPEHHTQLLDCTALTEMADPNILWNIETTQRALAIGEGICLQIENAAQVALQTADLWSQPCSVLSTLSVMLPQCQVQHVEKGGGEANLTRVEYKSAKENKKRTRSQARRRA